VHIICVMEFCCWIFASLEIFIHTFQELFYLQQSEKCCPQVNQVP
jgi:hypothetical protein